MDRRAFLGSLAGGLLAAPLAAEAQQAGRVLADRHPRRQLSRTLGTCRRSGMRSARPCGTRAMSRARTSRSSSVGVPATSLTWRVLAGRTRAAPNADSIATAACRRHSLAKLTTSSASYSAGHRRRPVRTGLASTLRLSWVHVTGLTMLVYGADGKRLVSQGTPAVVTQLGVLWDSNGRLCWPYRTRTIAAGDHQPPTCARASDTAPRHRGLLREPSIAPETRRP